MAAIQQSDIRTFFMDRLSDGSISHVHEGGIYTEWRKHQDTKPPATSRITKALRDLARERWLLKSEEDGVVGYRLGGAIAPRPDGRVARAQSAVDKAHADGLPALAGSVKQQGWAVAIRDKALAELAERRTDHRRRSRLSYCAK